MTARYRLVGDARRSLLSVENMGVLRIFTANQITRRLLQKQLHTY